MRRIEGMETKTKRGRPPRGGTQNDAVRALRLKLGLTQQEMAAALECGISTVQKLEAGRLLPGVAALRARFAKLAGEAGLKIADFEVETKDVEVTS